MRFGRMIDGNYHWFGFAFHGWFVGFMYRTGEAIERAAPTTGTNVPNEGT